MTISDQIQKDMVDAMRSRDELRLSTLRMVKSALSYKEVEKRAPLDDKETQQILSTLIKQRRDSIEQFTKGGRQELADKEAAEIKMIEHYLPKAMGEEQIAEAVKATIAEMGSPTMKDGHGDEECNGQTPGHWRARGRQDRKRAGEEEPRRMRFSFRSCLLHTVVHCPSAFSTLFVLLPKCRVTSQITCFR